MRHCRDEVALGLVVIVFAMVSAPLLATRSFAQSQVAKPMRIYFVNGILTNENEARFSRQVLKGTQQAWLSETFPSDTFEFLHIHNKTDGLFGDLRELFFQRLASSGDIASSDLLFAASAAFFHALVSGNAAAIDHVADEFGTTPATVALLQQALFEIYHAALSASFDGGFLAVRLQADLSADRRVLLVAHSQGNLIAQDALAQTINALPEFESSIGYLGVAVPSATPEVCFPWVTRSDDLWINALRAISTSNVLVANVEADNADGDFFKHGFIESYLLSGVNAAPTLAFESAFRTLVRDLGERSLEGDYIGEYEILGAGGMVFTGTSTGWIGGPDSSFAGSFDHGGLVSGSYYANGRSFTGVSWDGDSVVGPVSGLLDCDIEYSVDPADSACKLAADCRGYGYGPDGGGQGDSFTYKQ